MRCFQICFFITSVLCILAPDLAEAGMWISFTYHFDKTHAIRLQDISFFLLVIAISVVGLRWLWNSMAAEFPNIPKLSFKRALLLTMVISLAFLFMVALVTGVRELLTPEAWHKGEYTYKLADDLDRKKNLEYLRESLFEYASLHDGNFPSHQFVTDIPEKLWQIGMDPDNKYIYAPNHRQMSLSKTGQTPPIIAYEPDSFGDKRFVLMADGAISKMSTHNINEKLERGD